MTAEKKRWEELVKATGCSAQPRRASERAVCKPASRLDGADTTSDTARSGMEILLIIA